MSGLTELLVSDDDFDPGASEGMCDCGKTMWDDCDCGAFFENWICGMDADGQCSMAGSEDCDFECPVMARLRALSARSP